MPYLLFARIFFLLLMLHGQAVAQTLPDIHGHSGCRGLMPENSLPGFLKAVELGVAVIDMDVVISADSQIVISAEPLMSSEICSHPNGNPVLKSEEKSLNIFRMPYADIQQYDCGSRLQPAFPNQQKIRTVKPTLKMAVRMIRQFASDNKYRQPSFSIELISDKQGYNIFSPAPEDFVSIVVDEIRRLGIEDQTMLQSNDLNVLEALQKVKDKKYRIVYVVEKGKHVDKMLEKLSFRPDIYSPLHTLLTANQVKELHNAGILVIPWTVNNKDDMIKLAAWGVDGIVTDFPDLHTSYK